MLSSVKVTGSLPNLSTQVLDWLPVDIAATAVVEASSTTAASGSRAVEGKAEVPVYHILNPHSKPTWSDMLQWLKRMNTNFSIVPPKEWLETLENLRGEKAEHPARKLIGLWRDVYCGDHVSVKEKEKEESIFETGKTRSAIPVMNDVQPIDEEMFRKIWSWIDKSSPC